MATKPTREQQAACDMLAEALRAIAEGSLLDGRSRFAAGDLAAVAALLAKASSAFSLDDIVGRALESRVRALGLRAGTADLILLMEGEIRPLQTLLLTVVEFKELVEQLEADLGEM